MTKIFIILSLCLSTRLHALNALIESDSMVKIYKLVGKVLKDHPRTLVVFDIDNTVLAMNNNFGSDQWFNWKADEISKTDPGLFPELLAWQEITYALGDMRVTQKETPLVIRKLQAKGIPVIALTSRSPDYREATERELTRNAVSFVKSAIGKGIPKKFIPKGQTRKVSYMNGIFMTQGLHKGELLDFLIRHHKMTETFSQIVFIDDGKKNVDRVYETFEKKPVDILSIRYSKEDERVEEFENSPRLKEITTQKLQYLRKTLIKVFNRAPQEI